jgi:hypothetical protein
MIMDQRNKKVGWGVPPPPNPPSFIRGIPKLTMGGLGGAARPTQFFS